MKRLVSFRVFSPNLIKITQAKGEREIISYVVRELDGVRWCLQVVFIDISLCHLDQIFAAHSENLRN